MNKTQKDISTKINNSKNLNLIINSDTHKLAHEDIGFLNRNEIRGVRMLLEITKPDTVDFYDAIDEVWKIVDKQRKERLQQSQQQQ